MFYYFIFVKFVKNELSLSREDRTDIPVKVKIETVIFFDGFFFLLLCVMISVYSDLETQETANISKDRILSLCTFLFVFITLCH